ncbi:RSP_7527 family protein [uncultured Neptuniibacter sp.]|uniref:RSP_7527 family protein n=1 Tax=uncultured Neptuniibacter sp. TaxID=502143 RepID=UPI002619D40F|nr:hypothetical protein [uncultured Neptuniibacter sp.]
MHNLGTGPYIEEARQLRREFTAQMIRNLFKTVKSLLQVELPKFIPGPLAHR